MRWCSCSIVRACSSLAVALVAATASAEPSLPASPLGAEEAIAHMRLAPGLRIELAACEPQVVDPVAIRFDARGRMWVVEMRDYPHGPDAGQPPRSRIRILEDRDGDGRFETAATFADRLLFATGVLPWSEGRSPGEPQALGAFVTLAGQVVYLEDADGDLRADRAETWYRGFTEENPQLRANHPRFALDNRIYIANGLRGGAIVDARRPDEKPLSISGLDFCFDPRTRAFEAVTGVGQFGLTFDDFGQRFVCSNRNPLKQIVLEDRYLRRNGAASVGAAAHDVAAADAQSRIFPISRAWTTSNLHAGQFTAACGVCIFRGDGLGDEYYGHGFTCDPTGNLVHGEIVRPHGAAFVGQPDRAGREFLASADEWFRPVNLEIGPDGALYVVDMYRAVIEHPQFMPDELKRRPDLRWGDDRGRIYRIVAEKPPATPHPTNLADLETGALVELLAHPNAWQRETAARLLYHRREEDAPAHLRQTALRSPNPAARVHALWLLEDVRQLDDEFLQLALRDPHPRVRENAVRLAETRLEESAPLREQVLALARDDDPRVRFQTALSLGFVADPAAVGALAEIAARDANDPWTRRAVALSLRDRAAPALARLLALPNQENHAAADGWVSLVAETAAQAGAGGSPDQRLAAVQSLAMLAGGDAVRRVQRIGLHALADALRRRGESFAALVRQTPPETQAAVQQVLEEAAALAEDRAAPAERRLEAIDLVAFSATAVEALQSLAVDEPTQAVRVRAIAAMSRVGELDFWRDLLQRFRRETPAVRAAILDGALARADRTAVLLDEIASARIAPGEIDQSRMNRLLQSRDAQIARRAKQILAEAIPADRQKVLAEYQIALKLPADAQRGKEVFAKNCATCHRIGDVGVDVAPDISDSRVKQPEQILTDVLQPNRAIDANYVSYTLVTADGQVLTGILASETGAAVTLKQPEGKTVTLARDEIEELQSNGVSLMPEGLEKNIPPQAMADLIAFIKHWRYLDGLTPLANE